MRYRIDTGDALWYMFYRLLSSTATKSDRIFIKKKSRNGRTTLIVKKRIENNLFKYPSDDIMNSSTLMKWFECVSIFSESVFINHSENDRLKNPIVSGRLTVIGKCVPFSIELLPINGQRMFLCAWLTEMRFTIKWSMFEKFTIFLLIRRNWLTFRSIWKWGHLLICTKKNSFFKSNEIHKNNCNGIERHWYVYFFSINSVRIFSSYFSRCFS